MSKPVDASNAKWVKGKRGRPPKFAIASESRDEQSAVGAGPAAAPATSPKPADISAPVEEQAAAIDAFVNPLREAPTNVAASTGLPSVAPIAPPVPAWENPEALASVTPIVAVVGGMAMDALCRRFGKEPLEMEEWINSGAPVAGGKAVLAWFPAAAELDPRYTLVAAFAMACGSLIKNQPAAKAATEQPQQVHGAPQQPSGPVQAPASPPQPQPAPHDETHEEWKAKAWAGDE